MLERWAKIGCENATVGKNGLKRRSLIDIYEPDQNNYSTYFLFEKKLGYSFLNMIVVSFISKNLIIARNI